MPLFKRNLASNVHVALKDCSMLELLRERKNYSTCSYIFMHSLNVV